MQTSECSQVCSLQMLYSVQPTLIKDHLTAALVLQKPLHGAEILIFKITLCMAGQCVIHLQISMMKAVIFNHTVKETPMMLLSVFKT